MDRGRVRASLLLPLLFATLAAGAAGSEDPPLAGTWEHRDADAEETVTLVLLADGTGTLDGERIRYSVKDDRLRVVLDEEATEYAFKLDGDRLTLSGGDLDEPTTFVRKGTKKGIGAKVKGREASEASKAPAGPVGAWEIRAGGRSLGFVFDADGSGSMNGVPLQWKFENGLLAITMGGRTVSYTASFTARTARLSGGDLEQPVTLERVSAAKGADSGVVGRWRAANGAVLEFKPDGTGVNRRGPFRYTAVDGILIFMDASASVTMGYRVAGDRLIVESRGDSAAFTKAEVGTPIESRRPEAQAERKVVINGTRLESKQVSTLERQFQVRILDGAYWYDRACGAWGLEGGPTMGWIPPRLDLGGSLRADAWGGGTGVFINGRELHSLDVAGLRQITVVMPGRYWVDERGNCGYEGNPAPFMNLVALAQAAGARGGGSYHSRSDITGIGSGGDGRTSYVMGKDWSVVIGD